VILRKKEKYSIEIINLCLKHAEFFLAGIGAQKDEGEGRMLLGVNMGSGMVMLRSIGICVLEFR